MTVTAGLPIPIPMPLTAIQLLWLNLIANGLQDVALAFEPKEGGELQKLLLRRKHARGRTRGDAENSHAKFEAGHP